MDTLEAQKIASARQWTIGFQRAISRDMAVEARYVGTRGVNQWSELNYNERNIIENGFYDEFRNAMSNFQANKAAGGPRAGSFAYFGPGSGTSPLPTYLAYINSSRDANNPAAYSGTTWTSTAFTGDMGRTNPQPFNSAADLDGDVNRRNAPRLQHQRDIRNGLWGAGCTGGALLRAGEQFHVHHLEGG